MDQKQQPWQESLAKAKRKLTPIKRTFQFGTAAVVAMFANANSAEALESKLDPNLYDKSNTLHLEETESGVDILCENKESILDSTHPLKVMNADGDLCYTFPQDGRGALLEAAIQKGTIQSNNQYDINRLNRQILSAGYTDLHPMVQKFVRTELIGQMKYGTFGDTSKELSNFKGYIEINPNIQEKIKSFENTMAHYIKNFFEDVAKQPKDKPNGEVDPNPTEEDGRDVGLTLGYQALFNKQGDMRQHGPTAGITWYDMFDSPISLGLDYGLNMFNLDVPKDYVEVEDFDADRVDFTLPDGTPLTMKETRTWPYQNESGKPVGHSVGGHAAVRVHSNVDITAGGKYLLQTNSNDLEYKTGEGDLLFETNDPLFTPETDKLPSNDKKIEGKLKGHEVSAGVDINGEIESLDAHFGIGARVIGGKLYGPTIDENLYGAEIHANLIW